MDKQQVTFCELIIKEKLLEIKQILIDHNLFESGYFSACIGKDSLMFNNECWDGGRDVEHPLNYVEVEYTEEEDDTK